MDECRCLDCGRSFLWETGQSTSCPHCGSADTQSVIADELEDEDG